MKIKDIINEIQYKSPTTFLDRENTSEYDIGSFGDPFKWHRGSKKSKKAKKISRNR